MPFSSGFWKCDIDEDQIEAVEGRLVWVDLHNFQGFDLVPQMSLEAKEAFEEANPSARINEHQCWPLHLPDICHPHPNAEAAADVNATHPTSPPVSLQTRMRSALQVSVDSGCDYQPGISPDMCPRLTTRIVEEIVCHPSFLKLADDIKTAFDGPWTATTRDLLIRALTGKIPELRGYYLKHMIRSLSYV